MPATAAAMLVALCIVGYVSVQIVSGDRDASLPAAMVVLAVLAVLVALGLAADRGANGRARTTWDGAFALSATDLDRLASRHFAERGWTAQRDDEDFKVFVRRPSLNVGLLVVLLIFGLFPALIYLGLYAIERPASVSIAITPVPAGAHIEMQGSWSAIDPFYRTLNRSFDYAGTGYPEMKATGSRR